MADFADNKRMGRPTYKLFMSYIRQAKDKQGRKPAGGSGKDWKTQKREADLAMLEACGYKI